MGAIWLRVAESRWMRMGVVLLTSAGALLVFTPVVRAMASSSDGEFNRWVGWANILALPIGFAGLALAALGWLLRPRRLSADDLDGVADVLAEGMLHAYLDGLKQMIGGDVGDAIRLSLLSDEPAPRWRSSPLIVFGDDRSRNAGDLSTIHTYFRALDRPRLAVLGPAGSGKTVLLTVLAIHLLKSRLTPSADGDRIHPRDGHIPYRLPIASYDPEAGDISAWIAGRLAEEFRLSTPVARELVRTGRILPMLDGLDELDSPATDRRVGRTIERVNDYVADELRGVVLASQPAAYEDTARRLDGERSIRIMALDAGAIHEYLRVRFGGRDALQNEWSRVIDELDHERRTMLRTPLWLSIAVRAFAEVPRTLGDSGTAAGLRSLLVDGFVRLACQGSRYSEADVGRWLRTLAEQTVLQRRQGGRGPEISPARIWTIAGAWLPRLLHGVLALVIVVPLVWISVLPLMAAPAGVVVVSAGLSVGALVVAGTLRAETPVRYLRDPLSILRRVPIRVTASVLILVTGAVALLWLLGWPSLSFAVVTLLCLTALTALFADVDETAPVSIRTAMRNEVIVGVLVTLLPILVMGFGGSFVLRWALGFGAEYREVKAVVAVGFLIGITSGIWFTRTTVRYAVALAIQAFQRRLPMRLGAFLDWAVLAGIMRTTAGSAYQFRHGELRQYFLTAAPGEPAAAVPRAAVRASARLVLSASALVSAFVVSAVLNSLLSVGEPSRAADPLAFVTTKAAECDGLRWKVPGRPEWEAADSERELRAWLDRNGAVDKGTTEITVVVRGLIPQAAVLEGIRPLIVSRRPPMRGSTVGCEGFVEAAAMGETPVSDLVADLDGSTPRFLPSTEVFSVRNSETLTMRLRVRTTTCDCSWRIEVRWVSAGKQGVTVLDDHGRPFRTTA
ncbi:NACHT domain-containing protein [Microbispora bryophytorum]|uniref:NACHT domain-containing protein n=1 Tax=Microbispora bryophytorum TaxID=1460882 RepID=UPI0033D58ADE